jgi:hypothetical protein
MLKKIVLIIAIVVATISMASIAPAYAQATRTWVSGVGDDANPCSRTAPCKTFAGAISKTATRGEINCLDSAGFGGVTIVKSISIICNGVIGGIVVSGTNAIIVNLPTATDRVLISGLDINGLGTGLDGIRVVGAGQVTVLDTTIQGFTQEAIDMVAAANTRLTVQNSNLVYNNGGINVQGNGAVLNVAIINDVTMDNNTAFSLKVSATGAAVISDSVLAGSTNSIVTTAGASVISYGGNLIRNPGVPTQTLPKQ